MTSIVSFAPVLLPPGTIIKKNLLFFFFPFSLVHFTLPCLPCPALLLLICSVVSILSTIEYNPTAVHLTMHDVDIHDLIFVHLLHLSLTCY